jgi:hypothetical protein
MRVFRMPGAPELQPVVQESPVVEALRAGDESAFLELVELLHEGMITRHIERCRR